MQVLGIAWIGVWTEQAVALRTLFGDVMGMAATKDEADAGWFQLADGVRVDVYGGGDDWHRFFGTAPAVGFLVDDAIAARTEMESAGVVFLTETQTEDGATWAHFRGPDGNVYEILSRR